MKKVILFCSILILTITGCTNNSEGSEQETADIVSNSEKKSSSIEPKENSNDRNKLPIDDIPKPSVALNGFGFDHSYEYICWNNCSKTLSYNYPDIHSGIVKDGDIIKVSWLDMEPKPTEILLHNLTTGEMKQIDVKQNHLNLTVTGEKNSEQYAIEFQWWKNNDLVGNTMLNTKYEIK